MGLALLAPERHQFPGVADLVVEQLALGQEHHVLGGVQDAALDQQDPPSPGGGAQDVEGLQVGRLALLATLPCSRLTM